MRRTDLAARDPFIEYLPIAELDEPAQTLFAELRQLHGAFALMAFLYSNPTTFSTADGIAFRLHQSPEWVEDLLAFLLHMGLCRRIELEQTFWGFTPESVKQQTVEHLIIWRNCWQNRTVHLQQMWQGL